MNISRFNPYGMEDSTVLKLATGREAFLQEVLATIKDNFTRKNASQHIMVYGPRGRGKSFFLKHLSIILSKTEIYQNCKVIIFPEEQSNIQYASDILRMVWSQLEGAGYHSVIPRWGAEKEEFWQTEYRKLQTWIKDQKQTNPDFHLIVIIENFQDLLKKLGKEQNRLRTLMETLTNFTLIGASTAVAIDADYNKPIFHAFKEIRLSEWGDNEYETYFRKNLKLLKSNDNLKWTSLEIAQMEARLTAISQYTGGSPRMAVVLTDLLLKGDLINTVKTLNGLVDQLTPYYQDLIKELSARPNSLTLFDALIRFGENLSQSELASKLGTRQNEISRAFKWLHENGYVTGKKRTGGKEFMYYVSDRIFSLYYLDREIHFDKKHSLVWTMADFLVNYYTKDEIRNEALNNILQKPSAEANDLIKIWAKKNGGRLIEPSELLDIPKLLQDKIIKESDLVSFTMPFIENNEYFKIDKICTEVLKSNSISEKTRKKYLVAKGLCQYELKWFAESIFCLEQAFEINKKVKDTYADYRILNYLGLSHLGLGNYKDAIFYFQKNYSIALENKNKLEQAISLEQLGFNNAKLNHFEEAITFHQKAVDIYVELNDKDRQAWNLGQLGFNNAKLNHFEEAITFYQKALDIYIELDNKDQQAWLLGKLGFSKSKLNYFDEAINFHQKAYDIYLELDNKDEQAWNLEGLGFNIAKLNHFDEAISCHQKALDIYIELDNKDQQAWNLGQLGSKNMKLNQFEKAITFHQKALDIYIELDNKDMQAWNLGNLGFSKSKLNYFDEAINFYQKAYDIYIDLEDKGEQAWNLGQIHVNLLLSGFVEEAWDSLLKSDLDKTLIFREWGDVIIHLEKNKGHAEAFKKANEILIELKNNSTLLSSEALLSTFFAGLIIENISSELLKDITEETQYIFKNESIKNLAIAAEATLLYKKALKENTGEQFLESLHPDIAIAVKSINKHMEY